MLKKMHEYERISRVYIFTSRFSKSSFRRSKLGALRGAETLDFRPRGCATALCAQSIWSGCSVGGLVRAVYKHELPPPPPSSSRLREENDQPPPPSSGPREHSASTIERGETCRRAREIYRRASFIIISPGDTSRPPPGPDVSSCRVGRVPRRRRRRVYHDIFYTPIS